MRSEHVFSALTTISNRYLLCRVAAKAARRLHAPGTMLEGTINRALDGIAFHGYGGEPIEHPVIEYTEDRVAEVVRTTPPPRPYQTGAEIAPMVHIAPGGEVITDSSLEEGFDHVMARQPYTALHPDAEAPMGAL